MGVITGGGEPRDLLAGEVSAIFARRYRWNLLRIR